MIRKNLIFLFASLFLTCILTQASGADLGTAFTYQGRLIDGNDAANGQYDFQFKLFDSGENGDQVGGNLYTPNWDVIDGYFTVELDFGSNAFNGSKRWLEIGVRAGEQGDPDEYTTLSPRQEITPAPYALYAKNSVSDGDWTISSNNMYSVPSGNVGIGTTSPSTKLDVKSNTNGFALARLNQIGNRSYVGLRLDRDSAETWFIGMNHINDKLIFRRSAVSNDIVIDTSGYVGIGTTDPDYQLDVAGVANLNKDKTGTALRVDGVEALWYDGTYFSWGYGGTANYFANDVGVGTTTPNAKLDVNGDLKVSGAYKGNIGPNGGAPFPRPAYDSGWVDIGADMTLTHNIGGDADNYVVDLEINDESGVPPFRTDIQQSYYYVGSCKYGAYWSNLTSSSIKIRWGDCNPLGCQVRVRIWVYN